MLLVDEIRDNIVESVWMCVCVCICRVEMGMIDLHIG